MLGKFRRLNSADTLQISFAGFYGSPLGVLLCKYKYQHFSRSRLFSLTSFSRGYWTHNESRKLNVRAGAQRTDTCRIALILGWTNVSIGIMLGVISSLIVAVYTILNKRLTKRFNSETITTYNMLGGFAGVALVLPVFLLIAPGASLVPSMMDLIYLLVLAGFCTVLLYLLVTEAMQKISAFTVNLSFSLEPLYSIVLAIIIFHENTELSVAFYVGLALIVLSVVLQMYGLCNTTNISFTQ